MSKIMMKRVKILIGLVTAFVLFDFVSHLILDFNWLNFHFPSQLFYNIFWTIGWGVVFITLVVVLIMLWRK